LLINRYAAIYQQRQKYDSAVQRYLEAAAIFTAINENTKIIYSYYNLSGIYRFMDDYPKAIFYARETRRIAIKTNDSVFIIRSLIAMADAFVSLKQYDSVLLIAQKGLQMASNNQMTFAIAKFHALLGNYYSTGAAMYETAIFHYAAALQSFNAINTGYDIAIVLQEMGSTYLKSKDYLNAVKYLTDATALAKKLQLDQVLHLCLKDLVQAEEMQGRINESFAHLKEYVAVNDSLQGRNNRKIVNELEIKYQTERKEAQLLAQEKTIWQKNTLNYILIGSAVVLLLISLLSYRTYQQKQKLQQQRISELETQQQLTATEAVLKGEAQERTRLARDLHDGLGGMLSGIKYAMNTMKGNLLMTPDNQQAFERSVDMLDSSIQEMRRVAHNMMPEALVKFGLDTALKDFCNDITQSGALKVNYQSIGMEGVSIDQTAAITIYRIVQELVSNSIRHASAATAIVQLTKTDGQLAVTVEDDGKGFDTTLLQHAKGIGWSNIQNRVDFLKAKLDIKAAEGHGTSVLIEINI
jgi:signal transduction histidine kinase